MRRGRKQHLLPLCIVVAAVFLFISVLPQGVSAEDKYWVGGSGSWNDPSMWDPSGVPIESDDVYLIEPGAGDTTVNQTEAFPLLNSLQIDATGTGSMTLLLSEVLPPCEEYLLCYSQ